MKTLLALSMLALVAVVVKASTATSPRFSPRRGDAAAANAGPLTITGPSSSKVDPSVTHGSASSPVQDDERQTETDTPSVPDLLARPIDLASVEALSDAYPRLLKSHDPLADRVEASLSTALGDASEEVRAAAVEGLGASPERNADRLQSLYAGEPSSVVRAEVVKALSRSRDFLRRVLTTDASADVRRFAAESARMRLGSRDCAWLAKAKNAETDPSVRQALDDSMRVLSGGK